MDEATQSPAKRTRRNLTERDRLEARLGAAQRKRAKIQEQINKVEARLNEYQASTGAINDDIAALIAALNAYESKPTQIEA